MTISETKDISQKQHTKLNRKGYFDWLRRQLPFKKRMSSAKNTVDDVEVSALKACHHLCEEIGPFLREVLPADDADRITKLPRKESVMSTALY